MMVKELKVGGKKGAAPIRMFLQTREKTAKKNTKTFFFLEGSQLFTEFCFLRGGSGNLTPAKSEG